MARLLKVKEEKDGGVSLVITRGSGRKKGVYTDKDRTEAKNREQTNYLGDPRDGLGALS